MDIEDIIKYVALCGRCRATGPETFGEDAAARQARDAGWADVEGVTLCPECRKEGKRTR